MADACFRNQAVCMSMRLEDLGELPDFSNSRAKVHESKTPHVWDGLFSHVQHQKYVPGRYGVPIQVLWSQSQSIL